MVFRVRSYRVGALIVAIAMAVALALVGGPVPGSTALSLAFAEASPWQFTTPFTNGRTSASSVLIGDRVYLTGGYSYDEATEELSIYNDVQWATLSSSGGVVGGWHETTPFGTPRLGQSAVQYGNYIYVIGGGNGIESYYNTVEYAKIGPDGNITPAGWRVSPNHLIIPRAALSTSVTVIHGQPYLYTIGGVGSNSASETIHFASVEYAPIHPDGTLGSWTLSPSEFTGPRSSMTTAIVNGCLYSVGGFGETFTDIYSDVQYACLRSDGSLGPWTTSPNSMHDARYGAEMVAVQSSAGPAQLVVLGGDAGEGTYLNEVERTTIGVHPGNTPWTVAPEANWLPQGQWGQTGVLFDGDVYVLGGVFRSQEYLDNAIYANVEGLL
jgi:hypothetical protein